MNRKYIALLIALSTAALIFFVSCWNAVPVSADPARQGIATPRPTLTPTPRPPGPAPRLHGGILDWGNGYMPQGVQVTLKGEEWEIPVQTDDTGEYKYEYIGNEVAFLNAIVPEGRNDLIPLTTDLPVRVQVDKELIVNLAFYPQGVTPEPIVSIDMVPATAELTPGSTVSFIVTVHNQWDDWVNDVIVADYLPEGLTYASATTSQGQVIWDRGLVWATLGPVAADTSATVTIIAKVDDDIETATTIENKAAVYYRENAAVQATSVINVSAKINGVSTLPVTGFTSILPVVGILAAGALLGLYQLRHRRK